MKDKLTIISSFHFTISPLHESALIISFDQHIDVQIHETVIALELAIKNRPFAGLVETLPAYASLAIFYDLSLVKKQARGVTSVFENVKTYCEALMGQLIIEPSVKSNLLIKIPVYYHGHDLELLANLHQLSMDEVIGIHTGKTYRVFMNGFLPGFAYMGSVDARIATPRHETPQLAVAPGSVGIAGFQTGIYPLTSPGGWQIIGRTPRKIFDVQLERPCLLNAGDFVQFFPINKTTFENTNEYSNS